MKSNKIAIKNIDDYIKQFPIEIQDKLQEIRKIIKRHAPLAIERISYQMPTFKLNKNLVHFAAFKNHIGFYPCPSGIEKFKDQLKHYDTSKGTIRFALDKPIPYELIADIVAYRVLEETSKQK
jgi:uncharacterized protein YdhG (YjbR/CyaY superfamily)